MIKDNTIQTFLGDLAAKKSTPGGGSAAAILGAMGAALVSMVANFTIDKKGYESVNDEAKTLLQEAESIQAQMIDMIQADVDVFDRVMVAYGMSKSSDDEISERESAIQAVLKEATDVPLACAKAGCELISLAKKVAEIGNKNVISDAGVAVLAAQAAVRSSALNVYININGIQDQEFVNDREQQLDTMLVGMNESCEAIYQLVKSKL